MLEISISFEEFQLEKFLQICSHKELIESLHYQAPKQLSFYIS